MSHSLRFRSPSSMMVEHQRRQLFEENTVILVAVPWMRGRTAIATTALATTIITTDGHFIISDGDNIGGCQNGNHMVSVETRNFGSTRVSSQQQQPESLQKIKIEEGFECSICLMELSVGMEAIMLPNPCSHMFHENCIMRWFTTSNTCPLCRRRVF